jgi:hypothetical protein
MGGGNRQYPQHNYVSHLASPGKANFSTFPDIHEIRKESWGKEEGMNTQLDTLFCDEIQRREGAIRFIKINLVSLHCAGIPY